MKPTMKLEDATWQWTVKAMDALASIAKQARNESKRKTTLREKLECRAIETHAYEGYRVVAKIFGEVKSEVKGEDR